jgi:hypothetical protein
MTSTIGATYYAKDGKVYHVDGTEAATARTANGKDLYAHDLALREARKQREAMSSR